MPIATTQPSPLQPGQTVRYLGHITTVARVCSADTYRLVGFGGAIPRRVIEPWVAESPHNVPPAEQPKPD